ncbi:DUF317 domain-containing protein [Kitasatospora sp. NPDC098663]|uniref:DUF317 domain-containing protein n=1 Tax=Kitasatospora sp. NPDC098663 TaxID=3364096 RepID=UPI0037FC4BD1
MPGDDHNPAAARGDQEVLVSPGYLAGPGDRDAEAAFADFLNEDQGWARYSCHGGDVSVAISECLTGRIQLDHENGDRDSRWTVAGYDSPVGERSWRAAFDQETPYEVALAVAEEYSRALSYTHPVVREEALWGLRNTRDSLLEQLRSSGWLDVGSPDAMSFRSPDGTAGLIRWDGGAFYEEPNGQDHPADVTLWVRPPEMFPRNAWTAQFSQATPTRLITAALDHLTDPRSQVRRLAEVPAAHLGLVELRPRNAPVRTLAATARTAVADRPAARASTVPPVMRAAAPRPARRTN